MVRMAQRPEMTNFLSFQRTVEERIFAATGILEDGSVEDRRGKPFTYKDTAGSERVVRNLREEYRKALEEQLNLNEPSKVLAFFKRGNGQSSAGCGWSEVSRGSALLQRYNGPQAGDRRGSVWYAFPILIPEKKRQRRKKMPAATLVVRYRGQDIPLVKWPTTIGGWR